MIYSHLNSLPEVYEEGGFYKFLHSASLRSPAVTRTSPTNGRNSKSSYLDIDLNDCARLFGGVALMGITCQNVIIVAVNNCKLFADDVPTKRIKVLLELKLPRKFIRVKPVSVR